MSIVALAEIRKAQDIARGAMSALADYIEPGKTEIELKQFAESEMLRRGATSWWLHGSGALVLCGERSVHSGPGDTNAPTDYALGENDIVTADLVPCYKMGWGDLARTFFLQDGAVVTDLLALRDKELRAGAEMHARLHAMLIAFVDETTTFEQLYFKTWDMLREHGYVNLDYHDNFGHTIERSPDDRVTIARDREKHL